MGHFERKFRTEGASLEWLPFHVLSKYPQFIVWFCHKSRVWQTEEDGDDSQDRASIAASCGKTKLRRYRSGIWTSKTAKIRCWVTTCTKIAKCWRPLWAFKSPQCRIVKPFNDRKSCMSNYYHLLMLSGNTFGCVSVCLTVLFRL